MRTTCYCKKTEDIVIKDLDDIITRKCDTITEDPFLNYAWNKRSIDILEKYYPKVREGEMTLIELCRKSGKSYSAVRNKVRRMGLHDKENMRYLQK